MGGTGGALKGQRGAREGMGWLDGRAMVPFSVRVRRGEGIVRVG